MTRAFSIARALCLNHAYVMQGTLTELGDAIYGKPIGKDIEGPGYCRIDKSSLTFNTGFLDKTGKEIFTGDYLDVPCDFLPEYSDRRPLVIFSNERGAFYFTVNIPRQDFMQRSTINKNMPVYDDFMHTLCSFYGRLDEKRARHAYIGGNIYDKLVKPSEPIESGERHDD